MRYHPTAVSRLVAPSSPSAEVIDASGRDPVLDGLRAVAIVIVLVHHVRGRGGGVPSPVFPLTGLTGVTLFFILSGLLITELLLTEKAAEGHVSLCKFYARRALRIFPAFYLFLVLAAVGRSLGFWNFPNRELLSAATYWHNLIQGISPALQHTWSLAVEEQFYLIWPLAVAILPRRWLVLGIVAVVVGQPILRGALRGRFFYDDGFAAMNSAGIETILIGALAAFSLRSPSLARHLHRILDNSAAPFLIAGGVYFLYLFGPAVHGPATLALPYARNVLLAFFLLSAQFGRRFPFSRALALAPWRYIGLMSYSIYLWQQIFLVALSRSQLGTVPALCLTALASVLSYRFIERPFLKLRHAFGLARREEVPIERTAPLGAPSMTGRASGGAAADSTPGPPA